MFGTCCCSTLCMSEFVLSVPTIKMYNCYLFAFVTPLVFKHRIAHILIDQLYEKNLHAKSKR